MPLGASTHEKNAYLVTASGKEITRFHVGDGIGHLRAAPDGTAWLGYFDEGVFGDTIANGGVVQFGVDGGVLWKHNEAMASIKDYDVTPIVSDCYAMTLAGDEIWTCFYSEFPIVRAVKGVTRLWRNTVISGAKALAVDGTTVALAGGYGEDKNRLALMRLGEDQATLIGATRHPALVDAQLVQGLGNTLHIVKDRQWHHVRVSEITT